MAQPTDYYVDPSIAGASGAGTVGDPYGDIQHALDTVTRDATNGDRFNIKSGTDEILAATLGLATYGTPAETAPLIFQGYTSTAGDGGIGGIDGNAGNFAMMAATGYVSWIDMHLHNTGTAGVVTCGTQNCIYNCEVDTTTGIALALSSYSRIMNNHIHTFGTYGIQQPNLYATILGNYISDASATAAIEMTNSVNTVVGNIISIGGATNGIELSYDSQVVIGNSILSASGSGTGILKNANRHTQVIINNLVEGFTTGTGIDLGNYSQNIAMYGGNAAYNNGTDFDTVGGSDWIYDFGDNESLGASPFSKSGSDTFANRATYFAPADTGNVQGGAYPTAFRRDKGAVQHADPAGGGAPGSSNMAGGVLC